MLLVALSTGEADLLSRLAPSFPRKLAGAQASRNRESEFTLRCNLGWLEFFPYASVFSRPKRHDSSLCEYRSLLPMKTLIIPPSATARR
jgi:hypothetical protein